MVGTRKLAPNGGSDATYPKVALAFTQGRLAWVGWALLGLMACGGAASRGNSSGAAGSASGAGTSAAGTGAASSGAAGLPGVGGLPQAGEAGAPSSSAAGAAGDAPLPQLPGASAEEEEVIAPLFADASAASGDFDALLALAAKVGLARGYAMCRCFRSPMAPPDDVPRLVAQCARDEAGLLGSLTWFPSLERGPIPNRDSQQCLKDRGPSPELIQALLCAIQHSQLDGQYWISWCLADQTMPFTITPLTCDVEAWSAAQNACNYVTYCADGAPVPGYRCNSYSECADGSDEQGCFEIDGNDEFVCGGRPVSTWSLCTDECTLGLQPPVCDPDRRDEFKCADGGHVALQLMCNRTQDCADGSDEASCLR